VTQLEETLQQEGCRTHPVRYRRGAAAVSQALVGPEREEALCAVQQRSVVKL